MDILHSTLQLCLQRDTRFNRSWNKKYENSNIFFLLIVAVDAQKLPTERSLKVLRLKCTNRETVSSQDMRWL